MDYIADQFRKQQILEKQMQMDRIKAILNKPQVINLEGGEPVFRIRDPPPRLYDRIKAILNKPQVINLEGGDPVRDPPPIVVDRSQIPDVINLGHGEYRLVDRSQIPNVINLGRGELIESQIINLEENVPVINLREQAAREAGRRLQRTINAVKAGKYIYFRHPHEDPEFGTYPLALQRYIENKTLAYLLSSKNPYRDRPFSDPLWEAYYEYEEDPDHPI